MTPEALARFKKYVTPGVISDCWIWTGATSKSGYGVFWPGGRGMRYAHRCAFEHFKGPIPPGYEVDHLCRVRPCVNPRHLDAVTRTTNVRRQYGISDDDRCRRGHSAWRLQLSGRYCRVCKTDVARERRHAA